MLQLVSSSRPVHPALIACAAAIALVHGAPARAGPLVMVADVPCPNRERIVHALERVIAPSPADQPDRVLVVRLLAPAVLEMRLVGTTDTTFARTLAFAQRDCPALPATLSLVLESWLRNDLLDSALSVRPEAGVPAPRTEPLDPAPAPIAVAQRSPPAPGPFTLAVLGGGTYAPGQPRMGAAWSALAEFAPGDRWGLGILGVYRGAVANPVPSGGTISIASWALGALASLRAPLGTSVHLEFLAGAAVDAIQARARVIIPRAVPTRATLAGVGAVHLRIAAFERLWWLTSVDVFVRPQSRAFAVDGATVAEVGALRLTVQTGFAWEVD